MENIERDLNEIEARILDCQSYKFGMRNADKLAHEDVPALLALVREQQAKLEAVRSDMQDAMAEAWEKGMADAKLQALGIKPLVRNPYIEEGK